MSKQNVANLQNEIPFDNLKEQNTDTCYGMGEHQKTPHSVKKLMKAIKYSESIFCEVSRKDTFTETVIGSVVSWDWESVIGN